jgi:prefoldin subunit 5
VVAGVEEVNILNKQRRAEISKIHDNISLQIETISRAKEDLDLIREDEAFAMDSIPEGLQNSERYESMEEACEYLEEAIEKIDECVRQMNDICSTLLLAKG